MQVENAFKLIITRRSLLASIQQQKDRGLLESAFWSSELLNAISISYPSPENEEIGARIPNELADSKTDHCKLLLAKSCFSMREYRRSAHILLGSANTKAIFLRNYALFLAGEESKKQEEVELGEGIVGENPELVGVLEELYSHYCSGKMDGFCMYLYAMVLGIVQKTKVNLENRDSFKPARIERRASQSLNQSITSSEIVADESLAEGSVFDDSAVESEAFQRAMAISSICAYPWNWFAWIELNRSIKDAVMLKRIESLVPDHIFKPFWLADAQMKIHKTKEALETLLKLYQQYPKHTYVKTQIAVAYHNLRNAGSAYELFEEVRNEDPFRLDSMDIFSNVLYIKDDRAGLRYLAHHFAKIDKYSPQTCCIIGNHYSLSGEHQKAVVSYLRALQLDPKYIDAWTLIGHEYILMKDANHAIAAYRKAVDTDARAFRAWYGLGQAYELLYMPQYALYYYEHAAELQPHDSRMWCALGACYEVMGQLDNTLLCYHRAEANQDEEGDILHLLAEVYKKLGRHDNAAIYYTRNLNQNERDSPHPQHIISALHFLAHYSKDQGNLSQAMQYCSRLVDFNGPEKDEIKALMREITTSANHIPLASSSTEK
jgi:anaphase-promoting complex subunit 8